MPALRSSLPAGTIPEPGGTEAYAPVPAALVAAADPPGGQTQTDRE